VDIDADEGVNNPFRGNMNGGNDNDSDY